MTISSSFASRAGAAGLALVAAACADGEPARNRPPPDMPAPALAPAERLALWQLQSPREPIPAAVTFQRELTFEELQDFLERQGLVPFSVHLRLGGSTFARRSAPELASFTEVGRAREQALDHLLSTLCNPGAIQARLDPPTWRDPASQAALERAMLTAIELSRRSLAELREGAPLVYGAGVVSALAAIERLPVDPVVRRVEPWMRMTIGGVERLVGSEPDEPEARPADRLEWVETLDPAGVRSRLLEAAREPPAECRQWTERQEALRREAAVSRGLQFERPLPPADSQRGGQLPNGLVLAAEKIVGFLRGQVGFENIHLADTVTLYLGAEEGRTRVRMPRDSLRDPTNWRVPSEELRAVYRFTPIAGLTELTTSEGHHFRCFEYPLAADFPELARLPHVGTKLEPPGATSCLQSWNLTLVFGPEAGPPRLVAAVFDQWEW
jgi:hypothetical protein